jgi:hypothetical protein
MPAMAVVQSAHLSPLYRNRRQASSHREARVFLQSKR